MGVLGSSWVLGTPGKDGFLKSDFQLDLCAALTLQLLLFLVCLAFFCSASSNSEFFHIQLVSHRAFMEPSKTNFHPVLAETQIII